MSIRSYDFPAILAELVGGIADDWKGVEGPDSGVGDGNWYERKSDGAQAYVNIDQGFLSVSSELMEGELEVFLEDLPEEYEWIGDHISDAPHPA